MQPYSVGEPLYQQDGVIVTPSWVQIESTSFAVRTIVRLDCRETNPPRTSFTLAVVAALTLMAVSGIHVYRGSLPLPLAWLMLLASTALMLTAAWYAFMTKSSYQLQIALFDGKELLVSRSSRAELAKLYRELTRVTELHRTGGFVPGAGIGPDVSN